MSLPTAYCPNCSGELSAATAVNGDDVLPQPGDFSVCYYCSALLRFDAMAKFFVRGASQAEIEELRRDDPGTHALLMRVQRRVAEKAMERG